MADENHTTTPPEVWKPVVGYEGLYEVSDQGRIRSLHKRSAGRLLVPAFDGRYPAVHLSKQGMRRPYRLHIVVLETFRGPRPEGMEARHINGRDTDARLSNLAWGTKMENCEDRHRHGTYAKKLSASDVRTIRALAKDGASYGGIAKQFAIDKTTVGGIVRREVWKRVA